MPNPAPALVAIVIALSAAIGLPAPATADGQPPTAKQCIGDGDSGYAENGKTFTFTMTFHNDCDRPIACEIDAYVVGARGPTQGHTTLKFPPKAQSPSTASYTLRVKAIGGMAQYSRECRFL